VGLDKAAVLAYRERLQDQGYSASTINQRLSAVRKLAATAGEMSLISLGSAAMILRVRGQPSVGTRPRRSLSSAETETLINAPNVASIKGMRDRAVMGVLVGCGLRRRELVTLEIADIRERDGRCVLFIRNNGAARGRIVPVPVWAQAALFDWLRTANITSGRVFRSLNRHGNLSRDSLSEQAVINLVRSYTKCIGVDVSPSDLRRTCAKLCRDAGADLTQIQALLGHSTVQATERLVGIGQSQATAPNDSLQIRLDSPPVRPPESERGYKRLARRAAR
jgi:integrase